MPHPSPDRPFPSFFRSLTFKLCLAMALGMAALMAAYFLLALAQADPKVRWTIATQELLQVLPISLLILTGFGFLVAHRLTRPLHELQEALTSKSRGTAWAGLDETKAGDFRELTETVNRIAASVRQRRLDLDEQLNMYQSLFHNVPCLITVHDREYRLLRYNRMFWELFDAKPMEHCYKVYKNRITQCENCPVERTFNDGKSHTTEEKGFYKDGTPAHWIVRTAPIRDVDGRVTAVMEMCLDITDRKLLEQKLRKSEKKYSTIFDNIPVAVFELNAETLDVRNCNRGMSQLYGYCKGEVIGKSFSMLFAPNSTDAHLTALRSPGHIPQARHMDKDGQEFFVSIDTSRTALEGKEILLAVVFDVTDRIRAEQQVIQSSKMATLGEMAAGVAHELNQPLAVLKMVANFFSRQTNKGLTPDQDQLRQMTAKIVNNVDRATKIIEHMREFGRKPNLESTEVQVNDVLRRACDFFSEQLKIRDITVNWELDADQPTVLADPNRLEQVFINLLVNARDAIEDKCSGKECMEDDRMITLRTRSNARHVVTEVVDTGPGIPKAVIGRIFEPFFSTKEVGRGTGLGLSICYDIVTDYDGTIHVFSKPGHGARFVVTLPIAGTMRNGFTTTSA
ncbi:PAS domain-containing sensor histidine kinase [Desulfonatronum thiodismutans]|uniref:PAS domain-containing sensor histidine kinase n=1 Tax=Desulfonatronum thiodismutans TaxID=159290 RepID=UPI000690B3ED|nr:PAS domain-containing sensor histidine kinase [Desulfonatronum thiodismutans]